MLTSFGYACRTWCPESPTAVSPFLRALVAEAIGTFCLVFARQTTFRRLSRMPSPKRVLFVCVENANRSQMAEALAGLGVVVA